MYLGVYFYELNFAAFEIAHSLDISRGFSILFLAHWAVPRLGSCNYGRDPS